MTPMEDDLNKWNAEYLYRSLKVKMTLMEDNLKILHVEYLSTHWLDLIQILNLSWGDQKLTIEGLN